MTAPSRLPSHLYHSILITATLLASSALSDVFAADNANSILVPNNRSTLLTLTAPASEVLVSDPDIADVHVHNSTTVSIIAKHFGHTNVRIMNKNHTLQREMDVTVGYDLPSIRKSLKNFLPNENIGVEMVNNSVGLTGQVSNAAVVDKALKITREFVYGNSAKQSGGSGGSSGGSQGQDQSQQDGGASASASTGGQPDILNFMQVSSSQQVMLRVRVGEIQRTALKDLGIDLNMVTKGAGSNAISFGTGGGIASLVAKGTSDPVVNAGQFALPGGQTPTNTRGVLSGVLNPGGSGDIYSGLLKALEQDGLFKVLAEPNLVAISGEQAEFLSGGEIPIPVVQNSAGNSSSISVEYKPFGVAVKFTPFVLTANRIRMTVQPEVSEISNTNSVTLSGYKVPSIDTRRAKTTIELAPGESFMIAGLITDQTRASIDQLPGAKELPVLGALFRSTEFQRNETELVIAVTPYIVDPVKSSDIKMPSDDFRPASQMELFFYGALGTLSGKPQNSTQNQSLEGPTGFMVD